MRLNVGVVFGGKSVEHEVSIISALQMIENMNKLKYNPLTIYLSKENDFYFHEDMSKIEFFKDLSHVKVVSKKIQFQKSHPSNEIYELKNNKLKKLFNVDLVFLVVHGTTCEDGTLSAYFELLDMPYVGSAILSSAINQNKWKMKQILECNDIPIVPYVGFYESDYYDDKKQIIKKCEEKGYPLIVKPASLGSSVGITKCYEKEGLIKAILTSLQYDVEVIVEKVILDLIELNCSLLGDYSSLEVSSVEQVFQKDEILSYQDKYLRGNTKNSKGMESTNRELPANISEDLRIEIETTAVKAIKVIGASGVSRIDFLYDKEAKKLYLNEINTIPGSLAFYLWVAKGKEYKTLIDDLIILALKKYRTKNTKIISYDSNLLSLPRNFNKGKISN